MGGYLISTTVGHLVDCGCDERWDKRGGRGFVPEDRMCHIVVISPCVYTDFAGLLKLLILKFCGFQM